MRKILVGAVITCLVVGLATVAMAAKPEISTSGSIEFKISGTSASGEASGLFGAGDVLIDYNVSLTSGPWTAVVSPEFDIAGGAVGECDAYMTYSGEAFTLTLDPTGIDNGIFDIYSAVADGAPGIPSNPGLKLSVPMENFSFYAVVNNQQSSTDPDSAVFEFGGGFGTTMGALSLDLAFNSAGDEGDTWYGSSYGLKVGYSMEALSLTGEYGSFSPSASGKKSGSGYYVSLDYTLPGGDSFSVSYTGSDKYLNGCGAATDHDYSKIDATYSHSLAEAVTLSFEVASEDTGLVGAESVTTWNGKVSISF